MSRYSGVLSFAVPILSIAYLASGCPSVAEVERDKNTDSGLVSDATGADIEPADVLPDGTTSDSLADDTWTMGDARHTGDAYPHDAGGNRDAEPSVDTTVVADAAPSPDTIVVVDASTLGLSCTRGSDCQNGQYCYCANADCSGGLVCTEQAPPVLSPEPAEFVEVSWNHRAGSEYSLDVKPAGQNYIAPCANADILGQDNLSYLFNSVCPSAGGNVDTIERFRICSCAPAGNNCWTNPDRDVRCTEKNYTGGSTLHIDSPSTAHNGVVLRWPIIPESSYCLHLHLRNNQGVVENCVNAGVLGKRNSYVFTGQCPSSGSHPNVALADIAYFEINSSVNDQWGDGDTRDKAVVAFNGSDDALNLQFEKFRNYYFEEQCKADPRNNMQYSSGDTMTAHTCSAEGGYEKRRLVRLEDYRMMGYPRSFLDSYGRFYLLFSTPSGGFPPAGTATGSRELNLVRTSDFINYEFVAQIDRISGNARLENGELTVLDNKMYISYNTFSPQDDCSTGGGGGRTWNLRLKVSDNYHTATPSFVGLSGNTGPEIIHTQCIANDSYDGFWEPYIYRTDANELRILYADDTPAETGDSQCNQVIRMIRYSETQRSQISNVAIGACPGDKRDGMPVVAQWPNGQYALVFESLGAPANQIVLLTSSDGKSWGARNIIADVRKDGGTGVGCPYIRIHNNKIYVSYYHTFLDAATNLEYSHYQIRVLDSGLNKLRDIVFEMRPRRQHDSIGLYYWGSINIVNSHIVGHGAAGWGHHFTEAWVPL